MSLEQQHPNPALDAKLQESQDPAPPSKQPFDADALRQKYYSERDKRLQHGGGIGQYRLIESDGHFGHWLKDPWVTKPLDREPLKSSVDVVIIGGGYGAQTAAVKLIEAGVNNFLMIEKAGDFGGTWYWNRYPGAQCDVESYVYMPLLEEVGFMPTEKYARSHELREHAAAIGRKYGLYDKVLFQTEVLNLDWNETTSTWTVGTSQSDQIQTRFVIPVAGPLHRPKLPGLRGIEDFKGHSFHTSRWDYDYTQGNDMGGLHGLADKKIALIGTGATALQIVPNVARYAKQLYVLQRTPSAVHVRGNAPTDPKWAAGLEKGWQKKRMDNFNNLLNGADEPENLVGDQWIDIFRKVARMPDFEKDPEKALAERQMADFIKMNEVRDRCEAVVQDKETAERLKPWFNELCKRPCFHDEYLQAFNNSNVRLIDTDGKGVEKVTENGLVVNGEHLDVDCIIYATGFELATEYSHRTNIEIRGVGGRTLSEAWKNGARTLHGWTTGGFPNLFFISHVQAAMTISWTDASARMGEHLAHVISTCLKQGIKTIAADSDAQEKWAAHIVELASQRGPFLAECTPGYYNNEGTANSSVAYYAAYGGNNTDFFKLLQDWRTKGSLEGLEVQYLDSPNGTNGVAVH